MKNFCILFTSKNNYSLFRDIFFHKTDENFEDVLIFNIDCDSSKEQKEFSKQICKQHNIIDIPVEGKSLPTIKAVEIVNEYLEKNNLNHIQWISVCQQDMYFKSENFFQEIEKYLTNYNFLENVGTVGVAVDGIKPIRVYGRGNVIDGMIERDGYFKDIPESYKNVDYFLVEVTYYDTIFINRNLFNKYIKPDYNFILNLWGDDISNQFLINNCCNITLPNLVVHDDHAYKNALGFPSCNSYYDTYYHGDHWNHHKFWNEKYGYHMFYDLDAKTIEGKKQKRLDIYNSVREKYKGTLLDEMFDWHLNDGPKQLKDVKDILKNRKDVKYF